MIRFEQDVTIHRPVADVFAFLADPANLSLWQENAVRSVTVTPGPPRVGSTFEETLRMPWGAVTLRGEITAFEADRVWAFRASSKTLGLQATFELEPVPGGTRLTKKGSCEVTGLLRLIEPMVGRDAPRMVRDELARLRAHLEAARAAS